MKLQKRHLPIWHAILSGLFMPLVGNAAESSLEPVISNGYQQIVQFHQSFATESATLHQTVESVCNAYPFSEKDTNSSKPVSFEKADLERLQDQWGRTMGTWMPVAGLGFGPVTERDIGLYIQSWPVRKGLLEKNANKALRNVQSQWQASTANITLQGLPAIEFLLFAEKAHAAPAADRCIILKESAKLVATRADHLLTQWDQGFGQDFRFPEKVASGYKDSLGALDDWLNGVVTNLEKIARRKLDEPFGLESGRPQPEALESFYSRRSLQNIKDNFSAVESMLTNSAPGGKSVIDLLDEHSAEGRLAASVLEERLGMIRQLLAGLQQPLYTMLHAPDNAHAEEVASIRKLHENLRLLAKALSGETFKVLSITRDFNSEDGD